MIGIRKCQQQFLWNSTDECQTFFEESSGLPVKAKPYKTAAVWTALLLVYLATLYIARRALANKPVFRMESEGKECPFLFLDE